MNSSRSNYRLSDECLRNLELIQTQHGLKSITAAIEFAAANLRPQADLYKQVELMKKHINELRRNEYLVIDLLNALTLQLDISTVPPHHVSAMRSPALNDAQKNLRGYLDTIAAKNTDVMPAVDDE